MRHKYEHLDSLRWIAAFAVGIGHAFLCFHVHGHLPQSYHYYGTMVFNGAYAVDFFFVLSGFVLINATGDLCIETYIGFIIRRLFRIYPAAWMSLMLSGVAIAVVHLFPRFGLPWVSPWAEWLLQIPPISFIDTVKTILLFTHTMNPVLWTILIELIASVFYPFFVHTLRKKPRFFLFILFPLAIVLSQHVNTNSPTKQWLHFLYMFLAGASLNLIRFDLALKRGNLALLSGIALMFVSRYFGQGHAFKEDLISTGSAALIITAIVFSGPISAKRILGSKTLITFGRSSYSYYLINPAILFVIVRVYPTFGVSAPLSPLLYCLYSLCFGGLAAAITVPLAHISAVSLERLSIRYGRTFESRFVAAFRNSQSTAPVPVVDIDQG